MKTYLNVHLAEFFFEEEMFRAKVVKNITTHILCSIIFPP
jgi:hypothetical protein